MIVRKLPVLILCLASLSFFTLNMAATSDANDFPKQKDIALLKPYNLYNLLVNYDRLTASKNRYSLDQNAGEKLPDTLS